MTDLVHVLPWALLAALLTGLVELAVLQSLRNRSATANIAALVIIPILAVLLFVVVISGFMYSSALALTSRFRRTRRSSGSEPRTVGQPDSTEDAVR